MNAAERARRGPLRCVRVLGELALTAAAVILMFVGYQLHIMRWSAEEDQHRMTGELEQSWVNAPVVPSLEVRDPEVARGAPFSVLRIPALGADWRFTVVEGTAERELVQGPGHYVGTAFPGRPGNVGIAGHRVGRGTPFDRLHELRSCDAIVFETQDAWYVYRVLPMADERAHWNGGRPECAGVGPPAAPYADTVGREIVDPSRIDVLAAVPGRPAEAPPGPLHLVTLTTCHPRYSARQRLIVHGIQVAAYDKRTAPPGFLPPELT